MNSTERFGGGFNFVNAAELDNRRHTGRIIDRAIKNLIALQLGMTPEMVPVRGVNDVFVPQFWIVPFEFANDVVRFERANLLFDLNIYRGIQRDRPELFCNR